MLSLFVFLIAAAVKKSPRDYPIKPVPFTDVQIKDNFWQPRMETNRTVTIPYDFKKCEETGRIDNFAKAGGLMEGEFVGIRYNDSDVYKVIEGAAYSLRLHPDSELEKYLDDLIVKIAAAQEDDGYLYTARTIDPENPARNAGKERWSYMIHSHELYNVGHMYEAAVAYFQATGKRSLLDVAIKNANLIDSVFGSGKKHNPPGHQEIEIGLAKLYRVTGAEKYLKLAKFFLDQRGKYIGREPYDEYISAEYTQDHQPVIEQEEAVGHAVRAGYMYSGMADVAALTGDKKYIDAIDKIWENVVSKKLYITGGIGARSEGEAFGANYELPNREAYNETCAAIANMFWNHRLFLLHGDAKYIDVLERTLYNGFLSGVGMNGSEFFYPNPLESDGRHQRSPWFDCACCPVNVVRFLPSLPGYVYAQKDDDLFINLFMSSEATIKMEDNTVNLIQQTSYPWEGKITIKVNPQQQDDFVIHIRIPGWAQGQPVPSELYHYRKSTDEKFTLTVNGEAINFQLTKGFAVLKRSWKKGDVIALSLPMPIQKIAAHDSVKADVGKLALERGPIVYCAEWIDNAGHVLNLMLPEDAELQAEYRDDLLSGVNVIRGKAMTFYSDGKEITKREQNFLAIPYYAWSHRGMGEMAVWLPSQESAAKALSFSNIK